MDTKEELDLIKEAQQTLAGLDLEKKKVYDEIVEKIQPEPRLESTMWDYIFNGVQCYIYDIENLLKNRKKSLDPEE
tara:strand:- start:737 stop:964 length:228 start_codon:yes stop_codon:yes gene_type:complete